MNKLKFGALCAALTLSTNLTALSASAQEPLSVDPITIEAPMMSYPASTLLVLDGANAPAAPYSDAADYLKSVPG